ncbi:unnamed protein product [Didymodactylos carnosus]|uniref:Uncharacterized protein n=1 Tax=Didymodactylos carnosus TaxID=1234261 RepID=A0A815L6G1_9BILA|nr:unnamed protein product [Didymodactylos carnosus]CAF4293226.1 unnamed protein product [Didymodactylos carnosus]
MDLKRVRVPGLEDLLYMRCNITELLNTQAQLSRTGLCSGNSQLIENILPSTICSTNIYDKLLNECHFDNMIHRSNPVPRAVCIQGIIEDDGSYLLYRHSVDIQLILHSYTQTVQSIADYLSNYMNQRFNHALIQHYRTANDNILSHSDKTLDIIKNSLIDELLYAANRFSTMNDIDTVKAEWSRLKNAFDAENLNDFDWEYYYENGFDIIDKSSLMESYKRTAVSKENDDQDFVT